MGAVGDGEPHVRAGHDSPVEGGSHFASLHAGARHRPLSLMNADERPQMVQWRLPWGCSRWQVAHTVMGTPLGVVVIAVPVP